LRRRTDRLEASRTGRPRSRKPWHHAPWSWCRGSCATGAAPQSSAARLPATGQNQPYPRTASRPASRSCSTAARPPAEFVL